MQRTDNFNLIVVEGSDTVNLLTQMNPNTEVIDEQMFKNQNSGVQTATELLNGTVHAITRSIPDASMIRFTAVSRFTAGDTFTVDGVQVSALLPSGEQLSDGAFIIGSEVLCVLKGTLLTVFAGVGTPELSRNSEKLGGQLPSYYATKAELNEVEDIAESAGSLADSNKTSITDIYTKLNGLVLTHTIEFAVDIAIEGNGYNNTNQYIYQVPIGYKIVDFSIEATNSHHVVPFGHRVGLYNASERQYALSLYLRNLATFSLTVRPVIKIIMVKDL